MKIAIICDVLGKENNGTTIAAMNLIRSLRAKGHDVRVVCPDEERRGEDGYYVVEKINFGIFNEYVAENGKNFRCRTRYREQKDGQYL